MPEKKLNIFDFTYHLSLARNTADDHLKDELERHQQVLQGQGSERWGFYNKKTPHYDEQFKSVLPEGFEKLVEEMGQILVLDAFGPLSFIRDLADKTKKINGGIALSLADLRSEEQRKRDKRNNIFQLQGADIYSSKRWRSSVEEFLRLNGKEGFDLITCLPISGWDIKDEKGEANDPSIDLVWIVTNHLWQLLGENGLLFIQYDMEKFTGIKSWIELVKRKKIDIKDKESEVRIRKNRVKLRQYPYPFI